MLISRTVYFQSFNFYTELNIIRKSRWVYAERIFWKDRILSDKIFFHPNWKRVKSTLTSLFGVMEEVIRPLINQKGHFILNADFSNSAWTWTFDFQSLSLTLFCLKVELIQIGIYIKTEIIMGLEAGNSGPEPARPLIALKQGKRVQFGPSTSEKIDPEWTGNH